MAGLSEFRTQHPEYDDMSDAALADALYRKFYSDMDRAAFDQKLGVSDPYKDRAQQEADKLRTVTGGGLQASSGGLSSGLLGNFDDELGAIVTAPFRMVKDRVGPVEAYKREQALNEAIKQQQRTENPVAATVGQVAGGLALAGKAGQAGATTAGRIGTSTGARALEGGIEGAGYGALYAAGDPGDQSRLRAAGEGAAVGGLTGGTVGGTLGKIANSRATAAANRNAPSVSQLADDADALYTAMRNEGVMIKPAAAQRMAQNVEMIGGNPNARLRPQTLGIVREAKQFANGPLSLERLDELRQGVNDALGKADAADRRVLMKIKDYLTNYADNLAPGQFTGDARKANTFLKEARGVYARKAKTELVESILDKADVKSSQFSQSGMANAIKTVMRQTYMNKSAMRQFSKEEQALIRQMAKGGSSSNLVNLLAKFAPRGVVSAGLSTMLGSSVMGPAGFVLGPAIGQAAAKSSDNAAIAAMEALRRSAATGGVSMPVPQIGRGANVLIGPSAQEMQAIRP